MEARCLAVLRKLDNQSVWLHTPVEATLLIPLTFLIIIGTVVIQSATASQIAVLLKVHEPSPTGILIIGADNVARAIGKERQVQGFKVVLT